MKTILTIFFTVLISSSCSTNAKENVVLEFRANSFIQNDIHGQFLERKEQLLQMGKLRPSSFGLESMPFKVDICVRVTDNSIELHQPYFINQDEDGYFPTRTIWSYNNVVHRKKTTSIFTGSNYNYKLLMKNEDIVAVLELDENDKPKNGIDIIFQLSERYHLYGFGIAEWKEVPAK